MPQNSLKSSPTHCVVEHNGTTVSFIVEPKLVKNLNLRIRPDGTIHVSANPDNYSLEAIQRYVVSRMDYILKELRRIEQINQTASSQLKHVSGETVRIFGRGQRLKVSVSQEESVHSDGVFIFLNVKDKDDVQQKKDLLEKYLNLLRFEAFSEAVIAVYPKFRKYDVPMPTIRIRDMNTRWGSCQPKRQIITLNSRLLAAPKSCIEYVVTHEFCHFLYPNHSRDFYNFIQILMPDWKERKKVLERI